MCVSPRATFWFRSVNPDLIEGFAERHDAHVWQCLQGIIRGSGSFETVKDTTSFPFLFGGLGLSSAVRRGAHWASWDCMRMVKGPRGGEDDVGRHAWSGVQWNVFELSAMRAHVDRRRRFLAEDEEPGTSPTSQRLGGPPQEILPGVSQNLNVQ